MGNATVISNREQWTPKDTIDNPHTNKISRSGSSKYANYKNSNKKKLNVGEENSTIMEGELSNHHNHVSALHENSQKERKVKEKVKNKFGELEYVRYNNKDYWKQVSKKNKSKKEKCKKAKPPKKTKKTPQKKKKKKKKKKKS